MSDHPAAYAQCVDANAAKALAGRLHYAATTMQNDDLSEPQTEKRQRHIARYEALIDAVEFLEKLATRTPAGCCTLEDLQNHILMNVGVTAEVATTVAAFIISRFDVRPK